MSSVPKSLPWSNSNGQSLLSQAAAVLQREAARLPGAFGGSGPAPLLPPDLSGNPAHIAERVCPVVGAQVPAPGVEKKDLRRQAHELLNSLFGQFYAPTGSGTPWPEASMPLGDRAPGNYAESPKGYAAPSAYEASGYASPAPLTPPWHSLPTRTERACPVTKAEQPFGGFNKDELRRQAHEFIDTLLVTFRQVTSEDGVVAENSVPLIQSAAPVQAGEIARINLTVMNEEPSQSEVTLYCTNLVADCGYDIPAMRVSTLPRVATIAARGQATFELKVSVPAQTPSGTYSGLVQAAGSKYVKAVLSVQVL